MLLGFASGDVGERREITMDGASEKSRLQKFQHAVGSLVGHKEATGGVCCDDGGRTALDEGVELLFGFEAGITLVFDFAELTDDDLAAAIDLVDEHANGEEGGEVEDIAWHACAEGPGELIELFGKKSAKGGGEYDLRGLENTPKHEHGKEIQEAERKVGYDAPIDQCNERDKSDTPDDGGCTAAAKEGRKQVPVQIGSDRWRGQG